MSSPSRPPLVEAAAPHVRRRRFLVPEVIQTSAMDCGPAALKCLLAGHDIAVDYQHLRDACLTAVDGTSIDALEDMACRLGLQAEQIILPVEHVVAPEARALPALAIVLLPGGMTHFVVIWRRIGPYLQVMDPARGRRWVRWTRFREDLYLHEMWLPEADAQALILEGGFRAALLARIRKLVSSTAMPRFREAVAAAVDGAAIRWDFLGTLEGGVRIVESASDAGVPYTRAEAQLFLERLAQTGSSDRASDRTFDRGAGATLNPLLALRASVATRSAETLPGPDLPDDAVLVRGTVLVRVTGSSSVGRAVDALNLEGHGANEAASTPAAKPVSWTRRLFSLSSSIDSRGTRSRMVSVLPWIGLLMLALFCAGGTLGEALAARPLLSMSTSDSPPRAWLILCALVGAVTVSEMALGQIARGLGRGGELGLLRALARKWPRLSRQYFASRSVSDLAERAHVSHRIAQLPILWSRATRLAVEASLAGVALMWILPTARSVVAVMLVLAAAVVAAIRPVLTERDLRVRTHAGALVRHSLDTLLGLLAIRTHRAEHMISYEHGVRLAEWRRAGEDLNRAALLAEILLLFVGSAGAALLVLAAVNAQRSSPGLVGITSGTGLLVLFLALGLPMQLLAFLSTWQRLPDARNVALRLIEPMSAAEDEYAGDEYARVDAPPDRLPMNAVSFSLRDVSVSLAGNTLLADVCLQVNPGTHVAIVGASGAGKSTLLGLLLGFARATTGTIHVNGHALDGDGVRRLRRCTAWVDPTVRLWNRSLLDNLTYGSRGAVPSDVVQRALSDAELDDVVARLPGGIDAVLGDSGGLLSGGEGQRVRLAREWIRAPEAALALLDEPFRGLDRDTRVRLMARVRERWARATLLMVTHDVEHTRNFDRVLVVENGRVVEDGAPGELLCRPDSRYLTLLEADEEVRARRWASDAWRVLRVEAGRLTWDPARNDRSPS